MQLKELKEIFVLAPTLCSACNNHVKTWLDISKSFISDVVLEDLIGSESGETTYPLRLYWIVLVQKYLEYPKKLRICWMILHRLS